MAQLPVNYCNDFKCELIIMCTKAVYTSLLICIKHVNGIVDHGKSKWNTFVLELFAGFFFSNKRQRKPNHFFIHIQTTYNEEKDEAKIIYTTTLLADF